MPGGMAMVVPAGVTMEAIEIVVLPRQTMTWDEFLQTPPHAVALDGMVTGGPAWDEKTLHANFDHHDGCIREATMSTAMQVLFAIKGGLMQRLHGRAKIYVNDPDQDTALACWLLKKHRQFTGVQSHPMVNRLLALNDRWDITGGAFPMALDDQLVRQHCWVFGPYTDLRKSGELATASATVMTNCLRTVMANLDAYAMGKALEKELDTRSVMLHESAGFKIVDEIGGNEARYALFAEGALTGYVSIVARRPDGRIVYTIGRRSRYVDFPVPALYTALSAVDDAPWGGSDLIGGSNRARGSKLTWQQVRDIVVAHLSDRAKA